MTENIEWQIWVYVVHMGFYILYPGSSGSVQHMLPFYAGKIATDGTCGKEPTCQSQETRDFGFDPWVRKIPWRRSRQPTPVFLPGESYKQRSLAGYSPWGHKVLDMTEATCTYARLPHGSNKQLQ